MTINRFERFGREGRDSKGACSMSATVHKIGLEVHASSLSRLLPTYGVVQGDLGP
jgi:hypothetical protein